jgi:hypothetical protein
MTVAAILTAFSLAAGLPMNETLPANPVDAVLRVEIEDTHLAAQSLSEAPLLIVFASEDGRLQTAFWLPAGGRYDEDFSRGTLSGLELEVVNQTPSGWLTSGALALAPKAPEGVELLWVLDCGHAVTPSSEGESLDALAPDGSGAPAHLNMIAAPSERCSHGSTEASAAFHVPVDLPEDKPKGDKPPRLRKKPLPPL